MIKLKQIIFLSISMLIFLILICYLYNDGLIVYKIQKATTQPLQLVEYYTGIDFSNRVEISNVKFSRLDESVIMSNNYMVATLLAPSDMIDNWFPESGRKYNHTHIVFIPLDTEIDAEKIKFSYSKYNTVRRWGYKTQRSINFTVMESENELTKIYVSIDMLGWYLWNKWCLGGMD